VVRKISLGLMILNLLLLESCCKGGDYLNSFRILDMKTEYHLMDTIDSFSFSSYVFQIELIDSLVDVKIVSNFHENDKRMKYAGIAYSCDRGEIDEYENTIDSISIEFDKNYNTKLGRNVTSAFAYVRDSTLISDNLEPINAKHHFGSNMRLTEPPQVLDTFQITIQLFDTNGKLFQDSLEQVIIKP